MLNVPEARPGLFASDDALRRAQVRAESAKDFRDVAIPAAERWRVHVENEREVREHARWRMFAWLLFIAPIVVGVVVFIVPAVLAVLFGRFPGRL